MDDRERNDETPGNFVRDLVREDLASGRRKRVATRFPPEPNGYLHIGHAKSIVLNFGLAEEFGGTCNLRFDDTNPETESEEYVEAIKRDIRWLGYDWGERLYFASDYFGQLYEWAEKLIVEGKAYVDEQSIEEIRAGRGSFHEPGRESPYRDRPPEESLALFRKMRAGEIEEGAAVLRAKIDMKSKDLKLRDPLMYRIRKVPHHRTGDAWCIYPMYDWAHGQSDAIEGITHSICTLEFVNHHALYDWFLQALGIEDPPQQIEFAKLQLDYTVTSKRRLLKLVQEGHVDGWDDPRMPTLAGLRRRGFPPKAIRTFCERVGVSKRDSVVDIGLLQHAVREELNATTPRMMAVLDSRSSS
ncbi:MAG TPA: glutamine--tRNA ligase [Sandaracinaceae bacterium]